MDSERISNPDRPQRPRRVGVFGGTFDPIHVGHLVAAQNAQWACGLDVVLFVVAGEPWQKATRRVTAGEARWRAVSAALDGVPGLLASRIELDRKGPSYTVDTLRQLHHEMPEAELSVIVGADAAAGLESWQQPDEIAALAHVVVVNRAGSDLPSMGPKWHVTHVTMPALDISSTDLRDRLSDGRPVDYLVPPTALAEIRRSGEWNS